MNKIYALYIILSAKENNIYLVSTKEQELALPFANITVPAKLKEESRYIMKNFFAPNTYEFIEECNYDFLDIQNSFALSYIKDQITDFEENDLCITYGGIATKGKLQPNLYWNKLVFNNEYLGYTTNKSLNLLIDNVINKTTL